MSTNVQNCHAFWRDMLAHSAAVAGVAAARAHHCATSGAKFSRISRSPATSVHEGHKAARRRFVIGHWSLVILRLAFAIISIRQSAIGTRHSFRLAPCPGSTVFDPEAQTRMELTEVSPLIFLFVICHSNFVIPPGSFAIPLILLCVQFTFWSLPPAGSRRNFWPHQI